MTPADFTAFPFNSVFQNNETEQIAVNIMVILKRTGDTFRRLSYAEYKKERLKDTGFSDIERGYFNDVIEYTTSADKAKTFSPSWNKD